MTDLPVRAATDVRTALSRLRRRLLELSADEVTPSQTALLSRLAKDGPATASALAAAERIRPQSAAATVASLEKAGLVVRHPDPHDGRRLLVSLTDEGRARYQGGRATRGEWLAAALRARCTDDELRAVVLAATILDDVASAPREVP
ncbi:MarR family winged helix-turn-helix transcriptional regulator [Sediminihabitans luteus]|uniref:MarR family winged helix-turn-helix transcriptional regulator n=1 Tax=Sediminihabitans luteus TaxID=1138585 RepID=UPI0023B3181B|nr:MarR family transcriptional regulator [Sediminihabitans luteus]